MFFLIMPILKFLVPLIILIMLYFWLKKKVVDFKLKLCSSPDSVFINLAIVIAIHIFITLHLIAKTFSGGNENQYQNYYQR